MRATWTPETPPGREQRGPGLWPGCNAVGRSQPRPKPTPQRGRVAPEGSCQVTTRFTVHIPVEDAVLRRHAVATGEVLHSPVAVDIDLSEFAPEERARLLEVIGLPDVSGVAKPFYFHPRSRFSSSVLPASREDWLAFLAQAEEFLARLAAEHAEQQAKEQAARQREIAETEQRLIELEAMSDEELLAQYRLNASLVFIPRHCPAELERRIVAIRQRGETLAETDRAAQEAKERAERERRAAEKAAWIAQQGSDFLRKACGEGYDCQRRYVEERMALELGPQWYIDWNDELRWRSRSCPSEAALEEALRLHEHGATVVWVTLWPDEDQEEGEAVVIENYLGRYTVYRPM